MKNLSDFEKKKKFLLCIDSDGCVMDTMTIKHKSCFGPCMIEEWELHRWETEVLAIWNQINLYGITRGINRFKGLALTLAEVNGRFTPIDGVDSLLTWSREADELSNRALESVAAARSKEKIFKKTLSWSIKVNEEIDNIPVSEKLPFPSAKRAIEFARGQADVAVVSSANPDALIEEWQTHGLFSLIDTMSSQTDGSKADCIDRLVAKGYDRRGVIMCGDSAGDYEAAKKCGVLFYPIIAGRENESWQEFIFEGFGKFIDGSFKEYGDEKLRQFYNNLNNNH